MLGSGSQARFDFGRPVRERPTDCGSRLMGKNREKPLEMARMERSRRTDGGDRRRMLSIFTCCIFSCMSTCRRPIDYHNTQVHLRSNGSSELPFHPLRCPQWVSSCRSRSVCLDLPRGFFFLGSIQASRYHRLVPILSRLSNDPCSILVRQCSIPLGVRLGIMSFYP